MPVYFEYCLKASFCLAVVFIFYTLLLKQMTYYTWNRYFLLIFSILSLIIPIIKVNAFEQSRQQNSISFINQIPSIDTTKMVGSVLNEHSDINYRQIFITVYLIVSSILFVRLLIQLLSIRKIKSRATLFFSDEVKIYHLSEPLLPFSFLNSIFINKDNYSESELQEIIDHERVHAEQKHTIDVLFTEIFCIVNWYNPFAWLIKKAVRENLEFIADSAVISKGVNKKSYQYLLLKATGNVALSITSSLKFSSLKDRFLMMNKTKTSAFHLLKFILVIPLITLLLAAFRTSKEIQLNSKGKNSVAETFTLSTLTYSITDIKIKSIVFKEQDKCLLKQGELFNLTMVSNEKNRLKNLLERNGYSQLNSNAITFLIDSSSAGKSFSVQVNINAEPSHVSARIKGLGSFSSEINTSNYKHSFRVGLAAKANLMHQSASNNKDKGFVNYFYLNDNKTASLI